MVIVIDVLDLFVFYVIAYSLSFIMWIYIYIYIFTSSIRLSVTVNHLLYLFVEFYAKEVSEEILFLSREEERREFLIKMALRLATVPSPC